MMTRVITGLALLVVLTTMATNSAWAGERKLSAAEIAQALAGNTVDGNWKGTPYKQFFAHDGGTTYVAQGASPSEGKWKVDTEKDQYCSWWQGTGWDCYDIFSSGPASIIWAVLSDGYRSPSKLLSGNQL